MQICSATIRLAGSVQNTVFRSDITPAEILVLQAIHGQDAVVDIVPIEKVDRAAAKEWDRLTQAYDRSGGPDTPDGKEEVSIIARLFPGAIKRLPETLKEIGLEELETVDAPEPQERKPRAPRSRRAPRAPKPAADVAPPPEPAPDAPTFVEGQADAPLTDPVRAAEVVTAETAAAELDVLLANEAAG